MVFAKYIQPKLATIELMTKILQALENKEYTTGVFLGVAEAFDTANHEILLQKLEH